MLCVTVSLIVDKVRVAGYSIEEPTVVRVWESTPPYTNWETWSSTLCSMPSLTCENIKMVYDSQRMTYIAAVEAEAAMVKVNRLTCSMYLSFV